MSSDPENFEQLRRLLALKRHEQPPPGYFEGFAHKVMVRIRAGEDGGREYGDTWWQRLWALIESRQVFAGAFGATVCVLLVSGILNSEKAGITATTQPNSMIEPAHTTALPFSGVPSVGLAELDRKALVSGSGTNPASPLSALFEQFPLQAQPVNYTWPNNR